VFQAQLAKLGIKVTISFNAFPTFRKRWLEERPWDIVQGQWDADLDPDETLFPELHSKETWNAGRWINPEFDRLVELAQVETFKSLQLDPGSDIEFRQSGSLQAIQTEAQYAFIRDRVLQLQV
jgi:ABC-type transport system substrate-binding protein